MTTPFKLSIISNMPALTIPNYQLYGEVSQWFMPEAFHIELLKTRCYAHDWQIKPHRHEKLSQLLFVTKGSGQVTVDGTMSEFKAPTVLFIPAMTVHEFLLNVGSDGYVLSIFANEQQKLLSDLPALNNELSQPLHGDSRALKRANTSLNQRLDEFYREYRVQLPGRLPLLKALLKVIYIDLYRVSEHKEHHRLSVESKDEHLIKNMLSILEQEYGNHKDVGFYANKLNLTRAKLNLITKEVLGKSPHDLITARVLLEAKRHILYTNMSFAEISYLLGFADPAYFSRFFKKHCSETPAQFRKRA